jgi:hypothetical protein
MNTIIKAVLTAACIVALAWPLLFWGEPAQSESGGHHRRDVVRTTPFVFAPQDLIVCQ